LLLLSALSEFPLEPNGGANWKGITGEEGEIDDIFSPNVSRYNFDPQSKIQKNINSTQLIFRIAEHVKSGRCI